VKVEPRVIGDDPANWDIRLARNPMYDGTLQNAPITQVAFVKPDGNLDNIPYALSGNTATDAGNYVVRITGTGNYSGTMEKEWAITPRNVTLTSGGAEWVYDGTAHSFEMSSNGKYLGWVHSKSELSIPVGLSNEGLENFFSSAGDSETSFKDVGTYKAYYYILTNEHSVISGSVDVTITPKPLWVVADAKSKVEGEDDPALTYRTEGLEEGDSLTGRLVRDEGE
jgi:hypothetical protein